MVGTDTTEPARAAWRALDRFHGHRYESLTGRVVLRCACGNTLTVVAAEGASVACPRCQRAYRAVLQVQVDVATLPDDAQEDR
jgi:hypothetical protein